MKTTFGAVFIFVFSLLIFSLPLGMRPFFTRGEAREALVVAAMQQQNNLILPRRNQVDIPSKPPLFHWLGYVTVASEKVSAEFAIRFPSAIAAALTLAVFFLFAAQSFTLHKAMLATFILGTAFEFSRSAIHARVDMVFAASLMLALVGLFFCTNRIREGKLPKLSWSFVAVIAICLAVLSKGPAGLLIPIVAAFCYSLLQRNAITLRYVFTAMVLFGVIGLAAGVLAGVWYLLAYLDGGGAFLDKQLFGENFARVVQVAGYNKGHNKPFYFSLVNLAVGFLPWTIYLIPVLVLVFKRRRFLLDGDTRELLYSLVWLVVFIGVVTVSSSKREVYLLPAFPAIAYILVYYLTDPLKLYDAPGWSMKIVSGLLYFLAVTLGLVTLVSGLVFSNSVPSVLTDLFSTPKNLYYFEGVTSCIKEYLLTLPALLICTGLIFASALFASRKALCKSFLGVATASLIVSLVVNYIFLPRLAEVTSPEKFMSEVTAKNCEHLYEFKHNFYAAVFYAAQRVVHTANTLDFRDLKNVCLLAGKRDVPSIMQSLPEIKVEFESDNLAANGREPLVLLSYR